MADHVIHGTGKPRFVLPTDTLLTDTVTSSNTTTVTLTTVSEAEINQLDETYGLVGLQIWSKNSSAEDTWGVIRSFVASTKVFTVESWTNGNPNTSAAVEFKGRVIDLPYCQRLTESFSPEYIVKTMLDGDLRYIKKGFRYRATLDYSRYLDKPEMEIIRYLYESTMNGCGFYPRRDNTAILYSVDIDAESSVNFYQLQNHQGHGGVIISIVGLQRLSRIPFNDPTVVVANAVTDDTDVYPTDDLSEYPTAD